MKHKITLKNRMTLSFAIISLIPVIILGVFFYSQAQKWAEDLSLRNTSSNLEKDAMIIDQRLDSIMADVDAIDTDENLSNIFRTMNPNDYFDVWINKDEVNHILGSRMRCDYSGIVGLDLLTSYSHYTLYDTLGLPKYGYLDSEIYRTLTESDGFGQWFPLYDSVEMFHASEYAEYALDNRFIFTYGKKLNMSYVKNGTVFPFPEDRERPILLIHFSSDFFENIFGGNDFIGSTIYTVQDMQGNLIYTTAPEFYQEKPELFPVPASSSTGIVESKDGSSFIQNQAVVNLNSWTVTSVTPKQDVVTYFWHDIRTVFFLVLLFVCATVFALVFIFTRSFSRPIEELVQGLEKTSLGNFSDHLLAAKYDDFRPVFEKYNQMNEKLQTLIKENYEIKLKEKELEIQVIHLQFNPHFMYNTLNVISLMALSEGQEQISDMLLNLSFMIRYCVKVPDGQVRFSDDFNYIRSYISLMQARYEHAFTCTYQIDQTINDMVVPKFMLQPFIENAILHGFEGLEHPGELTISARIAGDTVVFQVIDNGRGMDKSHIQDIWNKTSDSLGIYNIDNRIKLYYGEQYGVEIQSRVGAGTAVTITIPRGSS